MKNLRVKPITRIASLLMAFVMLAALLPIHAWAAEGATQETASAIPEESSAMAGEVENTPADSGLLVPETGADNSEVAPSAESAPREEPVPDEGSLMEGPAGASVAEPTAIPEEISTPSSTGTGTENENTPVVSTPPVGGQLPELPLEAAPPAEATEAAPQTTTTTFPEGASKEMVVLDAAPYSDKYPYYWASPDELNYYTDTSGRFCVVSAWPTDSRFDINTFDAGFNCVATKTVDFTGFNLWGGFYHAPDGYFYVAVGQYNTEQDDDKTVIEVRRYNASWVLVGTAAIKGGVTFTFKGIRVPFDAGQCAMTLSGTQLVVHTAREMYTADDGKNHQANISFAIDTTTMTASIIGSGYGGSSNSQYTSHSFNQYAQLQGADLLLVDHGDAHPRSVVLSRIANYTGGSRQVVRTNLFSLMGSLGENYTGTTVMGFELGQNGNLLVGHSVPHNQAVDGVTGYDSNMVQNVYLLVLNKHTDAPSFQWLTNYNPARTQIAVQAPRMVKLSDDRFVVLFTVVENGKARLEYRLVNSSGTVLASKSFAGVNFASGTQPLVQDGFLLWVGPAPSAYSWLRPSERYLYELNIKDAAKPALQHRLRAITLEDTAVKLAVGGKKQLHALYTPANAIDKGRIAWTSSSPAVAIVDANGMVTAKGFGTATVKATHAGVPVAECTVTVPVPVTGVQLSDTSLSLAPGEQHTLRATVLPANAANKAVTWTSSTPSVATVANGAVWAVGVGTATITVTTADGGFVASCSLTVQRPSPPPDDFEDPDDSSDAPQDPGNPGNPGDPTDPGDSTNPGDPNIPDPPEWAYVTSVRLSQNYICLQKNAKCKLRGLAYMSDGTTQSQLTWSSKDTKVATVNASGVVTGKNAGSTFIWATSPDGMWARGIYVEVVATTAAVRQLHITGAKSKMNAGDVLPLSVTASPYNAALSGVTFKSSKKSVIAVDVAGTLTAKKEGSATITVKANGRSASAKITVVAPTKKVKLMVNGQGVGSKMTLKRKKSIALKAVAYSAANEVLKTKFTYSSSKKSIATVSSKGKISAKKAGKTTITVKAANGKKATLTVTVKK